jgi:hypothetical protein
MTDLKQEISCKKLAICIPVHGNSVALEQSLTQLELYVRQPAAAKGIDCVLLVSNSGGTIDVSSYWHGEHKVLSVLSHYYWGASVQALFIEAQSHRSTHLLLMNHDINLLPDSLNNLLEASIEHPQSVLSSVSLVTAKNVVENAGFNYTNGAFPLTNLYMNENPEKLPPLPYTVDALNGRFVLFPSEAANPDYLKPSFVPHYFADAALSVKVRRAGYPLVVVPNSIVLSDQDDTEFKRSRTRCDTLAGFYNCLFQPYSYRYIWGSFWGQIFIVDNLLLGILSSFKYTSLRVAKSVLELFRVIQPL